jgi:hypothetical protein
MPGTLARSADYRLEAIDNGRFISNQGLPGRPSERLQAQPPAATITPYKTSDGRGYFTPKSVWIEDGEGSVIEERSDPRASFAGHVRATQWDQLQRHWYPGMEETCDAKAA